MIYSIIYKSKAQLDFTIEDIYLMLIEAKRFNKKNDIKGCILYHNLQFIQLIEGDEKVIRSLYASIEDDKRHYDVEKLISKPSRKSLWNDWSMAFYNFSDKGSQANYKRLLLETSFENAHQEEKASEILAVLREQTSILLDH